MWECMCTLRRPSRCDLHEEVHLLSLRHIAVLHPILFHRLDIPSSLLQAIISYKWKLFARTAIAIKTAIYLIFLLLFTAYAIILW